MHLIMKRRAKVDFPDAASPVTSTGIEISALEIVSSTTSNGSRLDASAGCSPTAGCGCAGGGRRIFGERGPTPRISIGGGGGGEAGGASRGAARPTDSTCSRTH